MNTFEWKTVGLLGVGVILAAAPLVAPRAATLCEMPQVGADARACAAAAQGPAELRRFVTRTRAIYGLYYADYVRPGQAAAAAPAPDAVKAASVPPAIRQAAMTQ